MAAAEYYNQTATQAPQQHTSYQQSPYPQPQELQGSPVPNQSIPYNTHPGQQNQYPPPPPYHPVQQQDQKPAVHFAPTPPPPQQHRPSFSSSGRPSTSQQGRPDQGQYLQPPSYNSPQSQHSSPHLAPNVAIQPPHMRPYMNTNPSEYSLNPGYSSDPEQRRRRRSKHSEYKDGDKSREARPRKTRSRSTNTDGFLGAAGGGLIGDMIFPGLGTVGGAVAGWLGGKDYGKHRKNREDKRQRDQMDWEHKFRDRSPGHDRRHSHEHYYSDNKQHSRY